MNNILTVGELKDLLQGFPDNLPVGVIGHFREFYPIVNDDAVYEVTALVSAHQPDKIRVLVIACPDIGPEPY